MKKLFVCFVCVLAAVCIASCDNTESKDVVKVIDIKLTEEEYAFAVKKGNTKLVEDFNAFLVEITENGKFDEIVAKYFENKGTKVGVEISIDSVANTDENFVVATNCPFEPFEYIGDDGKAYGIDLEIAALYAEAKGLELVVKNIAFDAILNDVNAGYSDMGMAGMTVNEDRLVSNDFTTAYYQASQKIIVAADNTDFDECKTAEDVENVLKALTGKKIGYQTGTTGNWYVAGDADWGFDGFANVEAKGYSTAQLAIQDLVNGQIYAVVVDEAPGAAMVEAFNK
ncbi:MAG: transporter substrate-binding domain-containing protein [Erysipelotrichaceae bacterium]|nr:transporter substrate-binding domain-containing protein [Erysipelotrichaceae bacterium]